MSEGMEEVGKDFELGFSNSVSRTEFSDGVLGWSSWIELSDRVLGWSSQMEFLDLRFQI
jgi:hypothetical protein